MSKHNPSYNSQRLAREAAEKRRNEYQSVSLSKQGSVATKPRALVIVDYEGWCIELNNQFGAKPNLKGFVSDIKASYEIKDIIFFADMSKERFSQDLSKLRCFSSSIIDTRNPYPELEKDYTDFFILDRLYQIPHKDQDIQAVILFSGDGHFAMAINFIKSIMDVYVEIYAVRNSLSKQLLLSADQVTLTPSDFDIYVEPCRLLLTNMRNAQKMEDFIIFFGATISYASRCNPSIDGQVLTDALNLLIKEGYVYKKDSGDEIEQRKLYVNWDKVYEDGLLEREYTATSPSLAASARQYQQSGYTRSL